MTVRLSAKDIEDGLRLGGEKTRSALLRKALREYVRLEKARQSLPRKRNRP